MQYITIISALFAAAAVAQPTAAPASHIIVARGITDLKDAAKSLLDSKSDGGCEVLKCVAALAPASVTCAAALVEAGANPIADAACFATGLNLGLNPPEVCTACEDEL